jgi:probable HAF family extracellular repeat protein
MNRKFWYSSRHIATVAVLLIGSALSTSSAQTYRIETLPPSVTTGNSIGFGLNENGVVVGWGLTLSGRYGAMRWDNATPVELGALPGFLASKAAGISNDDRVVGPSGASCQSGSPTLWDSGQVVPLPAIARVSVEVYRINDAGVAVGEGYDSCARPWNNAAFQWHDNWVASPLPPLTGDPESGAYGVSNAGVVVGYSGDSSGNAHLRACRWVDGIPSLIPDLGGDYSIAFAINDSGQYAGYSRTVGGTFRAYFFDGTNAIDLGSLPGYAHSTAMGVNDTGTVIGFTFNGTGETTIYPNYYPDSQQRAFVWRNGILYDMIDLIPAGSGWTSLNALLDINEHGQITGYGVRAGRFRAFLLTPILPGDLNCDGAVDFGDINPFVLALSNPAGYQAAYPDCDILNADCNGDGVVDFGDITPFVALLSAS